MLRKVHLRITHPSHIKMPSPRFDGQVLQALALSSNWKSVVCSCCVVCTGDPSQEPQVHLVSTSAAPSSPGPASTKLLPTGNVVGGLPAALMSHCQVGGLVGVCCDGLGLGARPMRYKRCPFVGAQEPSPCLSQKRE